jgi:hypothetical protein
MMSTHSHRGSFKEDAASGVKPVSYISFDAVVGRNSKFHGLTSAQQDELGGVEYRVRSLFLPLLLSPTDPFFPLAGSYCPPSDRLPLLAPESTHRRPLPRTLVVEFGRVQTRLR